MKKTIIIFLVILLSFGERLDVYADFDRNTQYEINGVEYMLDTENMVAGIYKARDSGGDFVVPSTITYDNKVYTITCIGNSAFNVSYITSITFPNTITSIEAGAFTDCRNLKSVTIPEGITKIEIGTFQRCHALSSVSLPESLTSIEKESFRECISLNTITLPSNLTTIGESAFRESSLNTITIPNSVTTIGDAAFSYCSNLSSITLSNNLTSIGKYAFLKCTSLNSITIPNSVKEINNYAFEECTAITDFIIPNSVKEIGKNAFHNTGWYNNQPDGIIFLDNCFIGYKGNDEPTGEFIIPEGTRIIASYALSGSKITSAIIPNSVKSIGTCAFSGSSITSISIPGNVTHIGTEAFYFCKALTSVTIGNGVEEIGDRAFSYCTHLENIDIPNSVTDMGIETFAYCNSLTSVTIGNGVKRIGAYTFRDDVYVRTVTLGNSVEHIGIGAFGSCMFLKKINIPNSLKRISQEGLCCDLLEELHIPESVTKIGLDGISRSMGYEQDGLIYLDNWLLGYKGNKPKGELVIAEGTIGIMDRAFWECSDITSIVFPNSMKYIGREAFSGCKGITSFNIPNSVTEIGYRAFYNTGWYNNQPDGILYLNNWLVDYKGEGGVMYHPLVIAEDTKGIPYFFYIYLPYISQIISKMKNPFPIDNEIFYNIEDPRDDETDVYNNFTLYVPAGTIEKYKSTEGWKNFKNIEEFDPDNIVTIPSPSQTIKFTVHDGIITVEGASYNEHLSVFTIDGNLIGSAVCHNGTASIATNLTSGSIAILKIGNNAIKIILK